MSAIWGVINLSGGKIKKEDIDVLKNSFKECVIDRMNEVVEDNLYMACGIQYFTEEAKLEVLPIVNKNEGIYFNADVILDNKNELLQILGMNENDTKIPDGSILYEIIRKDIKKYINRILGVYSFVYYDLKRNYLCISTDALGNRCIYYRQIDDNIYFSTLLKPLVNINKKAELNNKWIADFLAMDNLCINIDTEETLYEEIFRIAPAQIVTWDNLKKQKTIYWEPYKTIKEKTHITDQECKDTFIYFFRQAVKCTLRSKNEISILLSGGLDSTSVACFAAQELKKQKRILHSYTSIPVKEYKSKENFYLFEDESEAVKETQKYLENLKCTFIRLDQKTPWDERKIFLKHQETPYKSVENYMWLEEAMNAAYKNGSRVMLTGAYGNIAFSFGDFTIYMNTLLAKGKLIRFFKELNLFQPYYNYSRKYALKVLLKEFLKIEKIDPEAKEIIGESYISKQLMNKYHCKKRLGEYLYNIKKSNKTYKDYRKTMCNFLLLSQLGDYYTKQSLYTGVLERDPTRDKRVIEFCMSIPIDQFVRNGMERRLVNIYLKDYLPKCITNKISRGVQSADMKYLIHKKWDTLKKDWKDIYIHNYNSPYVDCNKALKNLEELRSFDDISNFDLYRHMSTLIMLEALSEL